VIKIKYQIPGFLAGFIALFLGFVFTGCIGGGGEDVAVDPSGQYLLAPPDGSTPGSGTDDPDPISAEGCSSSDPNHMCIGIKFVVYKDANENPVMTREEASSLIAKVNGLWQQCNIAFQIDEYQAVNPVAYGLTYSSGAQSQTTQIRSTFSNNTTFLVVVTGPWSSSYIAWTAMPGSVPYGVVACAEYGDDRVTIAHELGHYLGLDHHSTQTNLLYYIAYPTSTALTATQCSAARNTTMDYWQQMLR